MLGSYEIYQLIFYRMASLLVDSAILLCQSVIGRVTANHICCVRSSSYLHILSSFPLVCPYAAKLFIWHSLLLFPHNPFSWWKNLSKMPCRNPDLVVGLPCGLCPFIKSQYTCNIYFALCLSSVLARCWSSLICLLLNCHGWKISMWSTSELVHLLYQVFNCFARAAKMEVSKKVWRMLGILVW